MHIGMIGLGKMGGNLVRRLMGKGHACVVFDAQASSIAALVNEGAQGAHDVSDLVRQLPQPRVVWMMLPAGEVTEKTVLALKDLLQAGDILIDGGNANHKDDVRRSNQLSPLGIQYMDVGTSGGVWGLERGYCLMVGGTSSAFQTLEPVFRDLAPGQGEVPMSPGREGLSSTAHLGYLHTGPVGSGHFVKMVHNGIEYGLMQAFAEGFDILKGAGQDHIPEQRRYDLNLADITELWRRGSVVSSWLLDLSAIALAQDPQLAAFSGHVQDSGEGRWTIEAAIEQATPAQVLTSALNARFRSRQSPSFADQTLSALRHQFGGHQEPGKS
ncbi:MAG: decarboxylating 6-phosphogluconate dehydrogenase [Betaproteobacteria bacterium]|nr:decarboxylating 6-phosphogluconate dehydrogenase [Betaproteobacteria bacterium]NBY05967.1 decarboxylating 6-phosphogluconate dehydrogenase [Betaproteobacteria bacterium]